MQQFFFIGIVEDRQDPLQIGRVRVRPLDKEGADGIRTSDLPWAQVVVNNSASMGDVGASATGYVEGSHVVGFYADGDQRQKPMIIGSIPGFPEEFGDKNAGHADPRGVYPKEVKRPDVSALARTRTIEDSKGGIHPSITLREEHADDLTSEPIPTRKTVYPYSRVYESESGHIEEMDDTLGSERICKMHRTGTMYEMHSDGDMVTHVVKDNYSVVMGSDSVRIRGGAKVYIDGDSYVYVRGDADMQVGGNFTHNVKGDYTLDVGGNMSITTNGFYHLEADDEIFNITNANYFLNAETGITASTNAKTFLHSKDTFDINTNSKFTLKSYETEINASIDNSTTEGIRLNSESNIDISAQDKIYLKALFNVDINATNDIYLKAYSNIVHRSNKFITRYVENGEFLKIGRDEIFELTPNDTKNTDNVPVSPASSALIYNPQPLNPLTNFIYDKELQTTESGNLDLFATGPELFYEAGTGGAVKTQTNNDKSRGVVSRVAAGAGPISAAVYPGSRNILGGVNTGQANYYTDKELSTEKYELIEKILGTNITSDGSRANINTLDAIKAVKDQRFKSFILNGNSHFRNDVWQEINRNDSSPGISFMWNFMKLRSLLGERWCAGFASFILLISGNKIAVTAGVGGLLQQARSGKIGKIIVDTKGTSLLEFPTDEVKMGDLILLKQNGSSHATFFSGFTAPDGRRRGAWRGHGGNQNYRVQNSDYGDSDYTRRITAIIRPVSSATGEEQPEYGRVTPKVAAENNETTKQVSPRVDPNFSKSI